MEIILAIVVASAVIFFGALISMGNERQRRAIDNLKEQIVFWGMKDLQIKREQLAHNIQLTDPLIWFNKMSTKISGIAHELEISEILENPPALLFSNTNKNQSIIFCTLSPSEINKINNNISNRLRRYSTSPFLNINKKTIAYELSILNCGITFDLELEIAWKKITGKDVITPERLWMYILDEK
jgi:hypothetical protein